MAADGLHGAAHALLAGGEIQDHRAAVQVYGDALQPLGQGLCRGRHCPSRGIASEIVGTGARCAHVVSRSTLGLQSVAEDLVSLP